LSKIEASSLPGFPKDVEVQLHESALSIKATHVEETETKEERLYRRERRTGSVSRRTGSVSRRIALPGVVSDADVSGALEDGVLTLSIPIPEKSKPRQIEISCQRFSSLAAAYGGGGERREAPREMGRFVVSRFAGARR
jgi:HSP20 family protein